MGAERSPASCYLPPQLVLSVGACPSGCKKTQCRHYLKTAVNQINATVEMSCFLSTSSFQGSNNWTSNNTIIAIIPFPANVPSQHGYQSSQSWHEKLHPRI